MLNLRESLTDQRPAIATHMLLLGVFTGLRFPYALFPTTTTKAELVFDVVWEAIERIEHKQLQVIVVCSDGASTNCKCFECIVVQAVQSSLENNQQI